MESTLVSSTPVTCRATRASSTSAPVDVNGTPGSVVARIYADGVTMYQEIVVGAGTLTAATPGVGEFLNSVTFAGVPSHERAQQRSSERWCAVGRL